LTELRLIPYSLDLSLSQWNAFIPVSSCVTRKHFLFYFSKDLALKQLVWKTRVRRVKCWFVMQESWKVAFLITLKRCVGSRLKTHAMSIAAEWVCGARRNLFPLNLLFSSLLNWEVPGVEKGPKWVAKLKDNLNLRRVVVTILTSSQIWGN
jgi:hypothetical protein